MPTAPLISCVVPCHDYATHLPDAVGSLLAQDCMVGPEAHGLLEILIVDDGSTDGSVEVAHALAERFPGPPGNFRVLARCHTGSPARTRNRGVATARGFFCLCLDADDELVPEALSVCLQTLRNTGTNMENGTGGADVAYADYVEFGERERAVRLPEFDPALLAHQNIVPTCALFRRDAWQEIGGWRDQSAYEDWDFWVRLVAAGKQFTHVPRPLFRYRVHKGSFSEHARTQDGPAKAAIVLGSPRFFAPRVRAWARDVAHGAPDTFPRGVIPRPCDLS